MLVIIGWTQKLSTIFVSIFDSFDAAARRNRLRAKLGGCLVGILPFLSDARPLAGGQFLSTKTENIGDGCGWWGRLMSWPLVAFMTP
jgi:hypothetical protein